MQAYSDPLGKAIRSMTEVKEEKDLDSLFTDGKTSALTQTISGLDDFELIGFLAIQEQGGRMKDASCHGYRSWSEKGRWRKAPHS